MSRDPHTVLKHLSEELDYQPEVVGGTPKFEDRSVVVGGMGGSALPALLLQLLRPELALSVYRNYEVPTRAADNALYLAVSYSGNTAETLSFARQAHERGSDLAVVSTGGKLLEFARQNDLAHIQIPADEIQPRYATGYLLKAICELLGLDQLSSSLANLQASLRSAEQNQQLASDVVEKIEGKLPVVYAPESLFALAYSWKIKLNETAKIPAFMNVFPELNHNEFSGFDVTTATQEISQNLCFLMIDDHADKRVTQRITATADILRAKDYEVLLLAHEGQGQLAALFNAIALADWTTLLLAERYGVEPFEVPMVEDLKQRLANRG